MNFPTSLASLLETPQQKWTQIKKSRDFLLSQSDWTQFNDSPLTSEQKEKWAIYRQSLRDVPNSFKTPEEVIWPIKPE